MENVVITNISFFKCLTKKMIGWVVKVFVYRFIIPKNSLTIFMYHRITPKHYFDEHQENLFTTPETFEKHIRVLSNYFNFIDINEWIKISTPQKRYCAITFDDGWYDNYSFAFPILKKYNIPATIFINSAMVGTSKKFWFERLSNLYSSSKPEELKNAIQSVLDKRYSFSNDLDFISVCTGLKKLPLDTIELFLDQLEKHLKVSTNSTRSTLNWEEVMELSRNGISFGSHCENHSILTSISIDKAAKEMWSSFNRLKNNSNICFVPLISFPNGNFTNQILKECKKIGYEASFTASYDQWIEQPYIRLFPRSSLDDKSTENIIFYNILKGILKMFYFKRKKNSSLIL